MSWQPPTPSFSPQPPSTLASPQDASSRPRTRSTHGTAAAPWAKSSTLRRCGPAWPKTCTQATTDPGPGCRSTTAASTRRSTRRTTTRPASSGPASLATTTTVPSRSSRTRPRPTTRPRFGVRTCREFTPLGSDIRFLSTVPRIWSGLGLHDWSISIEGLVSNASRTQAWAWTEEHEVYGTEGAGSFRKFEAV
ncbi:hypothetical protein VTN77DRAFT_3749 [Rasamsonia byssochlamydoides]|uniref:uncharacterized protein n=1 Tax=Rasamsonia byssochlamydoides TaxID=89139 RepID=UPI003743C66A